MSDQIKTIMEDKAISKEQSDQERMQEFWAKYTALCDEYRLQIIVTPAYKISQDTGTWSTVLQTSIGNMPQN